jgi:putative heme-binding domain-containing protein
MVESNKRASDPFSVTSANPQNISEGEQLGQDPRSPEEVTVTMRVRVAVLLALWGFAHARLAAEVLPVHPAADSLPVPPDVPRALTPEESRKTFQLAPGMTIELVASEPTVLQPVCITFDDRGRLWVLQYLQYPTPNELKPVEVDQYLRTKYDRVPEPPPKGPRGRDSVVILEDRDRDGRFETHREFLTGLHLASGMALGQGGLFVVQPPYLLYYPDRNHDDVPDSDPEVLLKGFGMEDAHAFANSLTWGPDGWLYGAQGSTVTAKIRDIEFQQGIWRYHPVTRAFELFAEGGGNTWGIDFDRHGQLFAGGNTTEPLCHHVQGAYYVKGFGKHGPLHNPYSFGYFNPVRHEGFLGSSLTGGFVIYQGGLFSERYSDAVIYPNLRVNAMRTSRLVPDRSTFTTRFQEDFILSSDRWFRPVKSLVGPDGALYIADWYDYNISHTDPKDRSKWYRPSTTTGRIWRVLPDGTSPRASDKLPLRRLAGHELVDLLAHPNAWYRRESRRILMERRDPRVHERLIDVIRGSGDDRTALEAFWSLHVSGGLTEDLSLAFLDHPSEHVRAWTIRLLGDARRVPKRHLDRLIHLAQHEASPTVRSQLACTCKRLPGPAALAIIERLLDRSEDLADPHIPLLLWWAIEDKTVSDRARVLKLVDSAEAWNRPITRSAIVTRLARRYLAEGAPGGYAACASLLGLAPTAAERQRLIGAMEEQMDGQHLDQPPLALAAAFTPLLKQDHPSSALVRLALRFGLTDATALATARAADRSLSSGERAEFIRTLGELREPAHRELLLGFLADNEPDAVRSVALLALQRFTANEIATHVIASYRSMPPSQKDKARDLLVSRPAWSATALAAVESGTLPAADFSLDQVRRVFLHKERELTARAEKVWGQVRPATIREKQGRILAVSQILARGKGNLIRGKPLVEKTCLNCHQLFGEGQQIGPDLTAVDRKNLEVLLPNVIDPGAVIREGFQQYNVATRDGRILSGLLVASGAGTITILDAKGVRSPLREADVDAISRAETSLMAEGLLDPFSDQELCDLFAYLRSEIVTRPGSNRP